MRASAFALALTLGSLASVSAQFASVDPVFTPYFPNGTLNVGVIPQMAANCLKEGVDIVLLGGSNGEWPSLELLERRALLQAWRAALNNLRNASAPKLMFHVGSTVLSDATALAALAEQEGADSILSISPSVIFGGAKTPTATVVSSLAAISAAAPSTPLVYYHYPGIYVVDVSVYDLVSQARNGSIALARAREAAAAAGAAAGSAAGASAAAALLDASQYKDAVPTLRGIKYIDTQVLDVSLAQMLSVNASLQVDFFVQLPLVLAQLPFGATGTPVFTPWARLAESVAAQFLAGNMAGAVAAQGQIQVLSQILAQYGGTQAGRAVYKARYGLDLGPIRPPQTDLTPDQVNAMLAQMQAAGLLP